MLDHTSDGAYTIPYFSGKNYTKKDLTIKEDPKGIRFANSNGKYIYVVISSALLQNFEPSVIMSIIVHEIGHNFYVTDELILDATINYSRIAVLDVLEDWDPNDKEQTKIMFNYMGQIADYVNDPMGKQLELDEREAYNSDYFENNRPRELKKPGLLSKIIKTIADVADSILHWVGVPIFAMFRLFAGKSVKKQYTDRIANFDDYNNERFADQFAVAHGYGEEYYEYWARVRDFKKNDKSYINRIPVFRTLLYMSESIFALFAIYGDEHPTDVRRADSVIKKLEYELRNNKDLIPEHRAEIEDILEKCKTARRKQPMFKRIIDKFIVRGSRKHHEIGSRDRTSEDIFDQKDIRDKIE